MKDATGRYKSYLLAVLLVILAFNLVDRVVLGLVLQDIKADLRLSDSELGLLGGIAFALFYSVMGIPIARWADWGNRVLIISLTAALWSIMVVLCGTASSFAQLLLIRVAVGVGEAGCVSPAYSLIADYFTRAERPRAAAIYALGSPLSLLIGYFGAGWMNEAYGWRMTFMLLGLPGLGLAVLAWFTLKEPRRLERVDTGSATTGAPLLHSQNAKMSSVVRPTLKHVGECLWASVTFRHLFFCFSVLYFFAYGILQWQPAFFVRSYHMETRELGTWLAVISGGGGLLGAYLGGQLASRYAAHNERLQLAIVAMVYALLSLVSVFVYLAPNKYLAFSLLGVASVGLSSIYGPLLSTIQTLVSQEMRATALALLNLFANLIGMGLGPLAAGALSDAFRPWAGDESLRFALLTLSPGYLWVAWHLWRARRTVARDLEVAHSTERRFVDAGREPVTTASSSLS